MNEKVLTKISEGKTAFLKYDFEDIIMKVEKNRYYIKRKNKPIYEIGSQETLTFSIVNEGVEVTKKEYKEF